ncbi:NAD(+) diphosphatase [Ornithinimicrobium ciconiae]|uniref:NAD(+) diphosphatase n=1 Tax=Ornithinimicrobium ciconiae TaxID=2594265 RepID=UPI00192E0C66|nr:NAD(+) diphosphatase [Ornithinimicrobium ciconiae]
MSLDSEALLDLSLSRGTLHRNGNGRRDGDPVSRALADASTRVIDLADGRALTCRVDGRLRLVHRAPRFADSSLSTLYLGHDAEGIDYVAVVQDLEGGADPVESPGWRSLREAGAELDDTDSGVLTTAVALANWHARHGFCPRCGSTTEVEEGGWVRRCTQDGSQHYPRTDAAIIVAVVDPDERILLARGPHWPEGRLSVLAGFVEAGESLESAVRREVLEEVGLEVHDLSYKGNQPWPFPASLMVGYTARTNGTTITPDPVEIVEAAWFSRGELSLAARAGEIGLPPRVSIARHLIEHWLGGPLEAASDLQGARPGASRAVR